MKNKLFDNADSFAMCFDEEWKNVDCNDSKLKIDKVLAILSDHPFLLSNPLNAERLLNSGFFIKKISIIISTN